MHQIGMLPTDGLNQPRQVAQVADDAVSSHAEPCHLNAFKCQGLSLLGDERGELSTVSVGDNQYFHGDVREGRENPV